MAFVLADRVRETTTTAGTGAVSLGGAVSGFQSFSTAIGNANNTYYTIADSNTGAWEVGIGTYTSSGNTLSRDTVLSSSNSGNLVSFAANAKDVFVTQPASRAVFVQNAGTGLQTGTTAFTANRVIYSDATTTTATSANLTFDGTTLTANALTVTNNTTLSGGTANGVAYLNGSKVLTTGSALTFDGAGAFSLANTGNVISTIQSTSTGGTRSATLRLNVASAGGDDPAGTISFTYGTGFTQAAAIDVTHTNPAMKFLLGSSETMRLTSTGLGIGTSNLITKFTVQDTERFEVGGGSGFTYNQSVNAARSATVEHRSYGLFLTFGTGAAGSQAERMRLDSSGNLGLGVTPSAWNDAKGFESGLVGNYFIGSTAASYTSIGTAAYYNGTNWTYARSTGASKYELLNNTHAWYTAPSGTAGNAITFTQAMTLDASGRLLLGTTTTTNNIRLDEKVAIVGANVAFNGMALTGYTGAGSNSYRPLLDFNRSRGTTDGSMTVLANGDYLGSIVFRGSDGTSFQDSAMISAEVDGTPGASDMPGRLTFWTVPDGSASVTERARITSGGVLLVNRQALQSGITDACRLQVLGTSGDWVSAFENSNSTAPYGLSVTYSGASPNGTGSEFLYCADSTAARASIRSNGGLANYQSNNVDLSDVRTKKDITPAPSYWNKIGALEIVTYKYNDQTHDDVNVGVIAQQVEQVEPVWVDADGFGETPEDGVPLKTVYTKDITFAAIKALQEAMARIEALEAKVAALEAA